MTPVTAARSTSPARPYATAVLLGLATLAVFVPSCAAVFEDRPDAFGDGGWWRLFLGHLAHGSWEHFLSNAAALTILGIVRERSVGTRRFVCEYVLLALGVAVGIRCLHPATASEAWTSYRGLSGVVYGLTVSVLMDSGSRVPAAVGRAIVALLACKSLLEWTQGGWLLAADGLSQSLGVLYLPGSHVAGIVAALLLVRLDSWTRRPEVPWRAVVRAGHGAH